MEMTPPHSQYSKKLKSLMKQIYEKGCIEKFNKKNGLIIYFTSGFKTNLKITYS